MPQTLPRALALALVALAALAAGCGPCAQVAADRDAFQSRAAPENTEPHLAVHIPQKLLDDAIAAGLKRLAPKSVDVPGLGTLARYVSKLKLAPRRVGLARGSEGRYQLDLELDVGLGDRSLFAVQLGAEARPVAEAGKGSMELAFPADMLRSVRPNLPNDAVRRLTDGLLAQVPAAARSLVPRAEVERLARVAIDWLTDNLVQLVRTELLQPMGELARLRFSMPDVPLAALELVSEPGSLVVQARTTLPVARGLKPLARAESLKRAQRAATAEEIEVRISAATVVELANWAIHRGDLPGRYDVQGQPSQTGTFTAGLAWTGEARPLKVNVWSSEGACIRARIGARPRVALAKGQLDLGIDDAQVEEIDGPPLVSQAVRWAQALWSDSVETSRSRIGTAKLGLGQGQAKGLGLGRIALEDDALVLALSLGGQSARPAPTAPVARRLGPPPGACR